MFPEDSSGVKKRNHIPLSPDNKDQNLPSGDTVQLNDEDHHDENHSGNTSSLRNHIRKLSGDIEFVVKQTNEIASEVYQSGRRYIKMLSIDKVFKWQNDNPHILNYHRPVIDDSYQCFLTLFNWHNETINIWSHLIGAIIMMYLWIYYVISFSSAPNINGLPMHTFFFFSIFCMLSSASFHLMYCQSKKLKTILNKLDYIGVILMIFGSSCPVQYFYFYCKPIPRTFYMTLNALFCVMLSKIVTSSEFQSSGAQKKRSLFFLAYGFFSIVPFFHFILTGSEVLGVKDMKLLPIVFMATIYTVGAILYAAYVPERFSPGSFDLLLNSHQIMHICVVIAALIHYFTLKHYSMMFALHKCP